MHSEQLMHTGELMHPVCLRCFKCPVFCKPILSAFLSFLFSLAWQSKKEREREREKERQKAQKKREN